MVNHIQTVRLVEGRGEFGQKAIGGDANVAGHPFPDFRAEATFDLLPNVDDGSIEQAEGVGEVDAIISGVGTGGTLTGVAQALKPRRSELKIFAVEPEAS